MMRDTARNRYWERPAPVAADSLPIVIASVVGGLVIWQVLALLIDSRLILPQATVVLGSFFVQLWSGELLVHIWSSLLRILAGFLIGSAIGFGLGLVMGASGLLRTLLEPVTNFFRFIPPICWISPFLIWFGIGETSKVLIITYTVTFMVLLSTFAGVLSVPRNRIRAARAFGAGPVFLFLYVVVPSVARDFHLGTRIALGNAFTTIVTAEMIAAQTGLGFVILSSKNFGATDQIILAMISLGLLGFLVDRVYDRLSRRLLSRYLRA